MKRNVMSKLYFLFALVPFFWGCRDTLVELVHHGGANEGGVPVQIVLGGGSLAPSRTIAPSHIPYADWTDPARYTLTMTGTSDMGGSINQAGFSVANGRGILLLEPGAWNLTLTATNVHTGKMELRGDTFLIVQDAPTSAYILLEPVSSTTGEVQVQFTLPQSVVQGLDPVGNNSKSITVALYNEDGTVMVQGTERTFTVNAVDSTSQITYNNPAVAAGQYTLKLTAPFTGANNVQKTLGWQDILYVEGNRQSVHSVTLPGTALGKPTGKPGKKDKAGRTNFVVASSGSATGYSAHNITGTQRFDTYGDGLWIYAANWDGSGGNRGDTGTGLANGNGTWGNEVVLVTWDPVFDAEYYELEMLLHPKYSHISNSLINNGAKYATLPVTDAQWEQFRSLAQKPHELKFSGDRTNANYYKTKTYPINIYMLNANTPDKLFTFLAWREIANGSNGSYTVYNTYTGGQHLIAPDGNGITRHNNVPYRIGLEGDCNALAILGNSYAPMHWYGIRLRAVNEFGYGDWVYWKGGKN